MQPTRIQLWPVIALLAMLSCTQGPDAESSDAAIQSGLDALYTNRDPQAAIAAFNQVIELNPAHYGANYQPAMALEQAGRPEPAHAQWEHVLQLAQAAGDQPSIDTARAHLATTR